MHLASPRPDALHCDEHIITTVARLLRSTCRDRTPSGGRKQVLSIASPFALACSYACSILYRCLTNSSICLFPASISYRNQAIVIPNATGMHGSSTRWYSGNPFETNTATHKKKGMTPSVPPMYIKACRILTNHCLPSPPPSNAYPTPINTH